MATRKVSVPAPVPLISAEPTIGSYLARRLVQIGVTDVFSVPGDYNLTLLDYIIAEPGLTFVGCCNELNAGYAADGYARAKGVGVCAVTFTVGGLSVINAIAGSYSDDLPVICIVGNPNSNDYGSSSNVYGTKTALHHTIGLPDFSQELRCFEMVTCYQAVVNNLDEAPELIDTAILTALKESKPVYIGVSCNLAGIQYPMFSSDPIPLSIPPKFITNDLVLEAAVEAAVEFLNKAVKPVMVGGPKMRVAKASDAFVELADACGYALALMPGTKGLVPENHPHYIGTYWGSASSPFCAQMVESADAYLFVGPVFSDYSTVGYSLNITKAKAVMVRPNGVVVGNGPMFGCVVMKDFLTALSKRLVKNTTAYENYERIYVPPGKPSSDAGEPLRVNILYLHIQEMLSGETSIIVETGDSWFNCQKLELPQGCGYEMQMQYGSIGWAVGATLGYAQAVPDKRFIAIIGDGSFQVTAQDVSTMLRFEQKTIIFLINNGGYTAEVEIHDGPYNVIKNWNYTALVEALDNGEGKCWTAKVGTEEELIAAIATATGDKKDSLCFIEVITDRDDTSAELLIWGSAVSSANGRPPNAPSTAKLSLRESDDPTSENHQ